MKCGFFRIFFIGGEGPVTKAVHHKIRPFVSHSQGSGRMVNDKIKGNQIGFFLFRDQNTGVGMVRHMPGPGGMIQVVVGDDDGIRLFPVKEFRGLFWSQVHVNEKLAL